MDFFDSVCYGFSTISTGGFAPHDESVAFYNSNYISFVIMLFMFLGGVSFGLMYKAIHGDMKSIWRNDVFRAYLMIVFIFFVIFDIYILLRGQYTGLSSVTIDPLFHIISTVTSTGLVCLILNNALRSYCHCFSSSCSLVRVQAPQAEARK